MVVNRVSPQPTRSMSFSDMLLDGVFTGMLGAIAVALWFLVLDVISGHPLQTPALLGWVLLSGGRTIPEVVAVAPLPIAAYTAFHFVAFIVAGIALAYFMNLLERFPIVFFVILVLTLCFQVGFFAVDAALGAKLIGRLHPWAIVVGNVLAAASMVAYQWRRHPGAVRNIDMLWQDEPEGSAQPTRREEPGA